MFCVFLFLLPSNYCFQYTGNETSENGIRLFDIQLFISAPKYIVLAYFKSTK